MKPISGTVKRVSDLSVADLARHPVWRFSRDEDRSEPMVCPISVSRLPVSSLAGKIVGTRVRLARGALVWAMLGNIDSQNSRLNLHFVTITIERNGRWFHLARYHDPDYGQRGPEQLARFLGLEVDEVFPITYDVRPLALGDPDALTGVVAKEPLERLTRAQLVALAVP